MALSGNTIFAGDSITVHLNRYVGVNGEKKTIAEGGRPTDWLLRELRATDAAGTLAGFQNILVLIGTNDIGGGRSVSGIVTDIRAIWALAKARGLRVYAMTIPPVKGYLGFKDFGAVNARRIAINTALGSAFAQGEADGLIDLSTLLSDPSDPDRLSPSFDPPGGDHLHPRKDALGALLTRILSGQPALPPQPAGMASLPPLRTLVPLETASVLPMLLLVGAGGIVTYLLTRKRHGKL